VLIASGASPEIFKEGGSDKVNRRKCFFYKIFYCFFYKIWMVLLIWTGVTVITW